MFITKSKMKKKVSCKNRINPYFQFAKSEGNICIARGGSRAAATSKMEQFGDNT